MSDDNQSNSGDQPKDDTTGKQTDPPKDTSTDDGQLGPAGEKALAAWKQRAKDAEAKAKEAETLAARVKEYEAKDAATQTKADEAAAEARQVAEQAKLDAARWKIAAKTGLPAELVDRLTGSTEEELAKDAEALLKLIPTAKPRIPAGGAKDGAGNSGGPASLEEQIQEATKAGDLRTARALKNQMLAAQVFHRV